MSSSALYDGLESLPPYNEDHDNDTPPEAVIALRELIAEADAVLISTPEYNGTIPGQLKHALDWASRPRGHASLAGKPVAVIGASTSEYGAFGPRTTCAARSGSRGLACSTLSCRSVEQPSGSTPTVSLPTVTWQRR